MQVGVSKDVHITSLDHLNGIEGGACKCRFDDFIAVPGELNSENVVRCAAPTVASSKLMSLQLSFNGGSDFMFVEQILVGEKSSLDCSVSKNLAPLQVALILSCRWIF